MSTATATKTVEFVSWCHNQVLTRVPESVLRDGEGRKIGRLTQAAKNRQIEARNIEREKRGEDPLPLDETPWKVEFQHNIFKVPKSLSPESQEELIEWLRGHPLFETPRGFWEMGAAPDEPRPTIADQTLRIARATARFDVAELQAALDEERNTHNRPAIVQAAEAALEEIAAAVEPAVNGDEGETPSTPPPSSNG